jgi:hypothetical protein
MCALLEIFQGDPGQGGVSFEVFSGADKRSDPIAGPRIFKAITSFGQNRHFYIESDYTSS